MYIYIYIYIYTHTHEQSDTYVIIIMYAPLAKQFGCYLLEERAGLALLNHMFQHLDMSY